QIGGSVALAIVGTVFGTAFGNQIVPSLTAAGVPAQLVAGFQQGISSGQVDLGQLTGTGDLGQTILANAGQLASVIAPYITNIVTGTQEAFSPAVAPTFGIGVGAGSIAALAAAMMQELALSSQNAAEQRAAARPEGQRPAVPAAE